MSAPGTVGGSGPVTVEPAAPNTHIHSQKAHAMSEPVTKGEMEAHLRVVKAEAETVRVGVEGKLDRVLDAISALADKVGAQITTIDAKLDSAVSDVRDDNKTTRRVTLVTIILSVMAAVAAIYAAQANNIAAMAVGIETTRDAMATQPVAAPVPTASPAALVKQ